MRIFININIVCKNSKLTTISFYLHSVQHFWIWNCRNPWSSNIFLLADSHLLVSFWFFTLFIFVILCTSCFLELAPNLNPSHPPQFSPATVPLCTLTPLSFIEVSVRTSGGLGSWLMTISGKVGGGVTQGRKEQWRESGNSHLMPLWEPGENYVLCRCPGGVCQQTEAHPDIAHTCNNLTGLPERTHLTICAEEVNIRALIPVQHQDCSAHQRNQQLPMQDEACHREVSRWLTVKPLVIVMEATVRNSLVSMATAS